MTTKDKAVTAIQLFGFAFVLTLTGCTITQELYIQRVDIKSPVFEPPLLISDSTKSGDFTLSPYLSFGNNRTFAGSVGSHTKVNRYGIYQLDTTYSGYQVHLRETPGANTYEYSKENMRWRGPDVTGGLQGEIALGRVASLNLGVLYASTGNQSMWGGNIGIGFRRANETVALRIDGGLHWTPTRYDGETVIVTRTTIFNTTTEDVYTYHDVGIETNMGFYGSFGLNTRRSEWFLNYFLQIGFARQRLTNYEPRTSTFETPFFFSSTVNDLRTSTYVTMLSLTPGIYLSVGDGERLLLGVRWNRGTTGVTQDHFAGVVKLDILF
jgi:hypothetical protein